VDADGVALAAIQGLNQKVDELKNDLKHRDAENAELKETVNELKKLVGQMKNKYDTLIQGRL
jgi:predicted nuclease with TOPRIM domain